MTALATAQPLRGKTIEIVTYRIEPITASPDHYKIAGWKVLGHVVVRVTQGIRPDGGVAYVDRRIVVGSIAHPLPREKAQRAMHQLSKG
jgi:hypothetical protein